jgi:alkanesulfonate monooxygenase SsuD/methylene tetrahydromethanopterin reductase-like flavin-dependent oxidoreductase (luciferase family)
MTLPAISLVAVPGRRRMTIDIARDIERRGFSGIYTPSMYGNMSQCEAMAWNTERIPFGTAIAPIYARTVLDFAQSAAFMHEVSGGRFRLGIGVAHAPGHQRMGVTVGKPLGDTRAFVERLRAVGGVGGIPADHHRRAAPEDGRAGRRDLAGRGVRQCGALAHGDVAGRAAGWEA